MSGKVRKVYGKDGLHLCASYKTSTAARRAQVSDALLVIGTALLPNGGGALDIEQRVDRLDWHSASYSYLTADLC